ncbi:MAG TPA: PAS domain-containing protein [Allosphingosinicella sp.]|nr:PAS domain-containing protein [Allosphingosinicella sp.]
MRALFDAHDWSASPVGPPDAWPQSLKTTVGLMLPAMAQIVLFWGPDYVALYNDAYAPTIGDKHPGALGRPAAESWSELWDDLEPLLASVRDTGETVFASDRPFRINRFGYDETVYFDISYSAVPDESGAVGGVLCIVNETTERVKADLRVRAGEARFHAMADSIDQMIWSTLPDGYHDYYNNRWYQYTGVPEGSTDGEAWNGMFHPDDQERAWAIWRHSLETGEPYHIEYRLRHRSGTYRWVLGRAQPVRDDEGAIVRWYGTCTDIHDRKVAEEALTESEARFRDMADSAPSPVWVTNAHGIEFVNRAFEEIAGRPAAELTGETWLAMIDPEDLPAVLDLRTRAWQTGADYGYDARFRHADGTVHWMKVSCRPRLDEHGAVIGYVGLAVDITDAKLAEAALRESGERLRIALDAGQLGDWYWDVESDMISFSAATARLFEVPEGPVISWRDMRKLIHPDDVAATYAAVDASVRDRRDYRIEYRLRRPGNAWMWVAAVGRPIYHEDGRPKGVIGVVQDISARKQAEDTLRETEERYRLATRATNDAIWDWDLLANQVRWNEALQDAYGYAPAQTGEDGAWWLDHIHPDDRARIDESIHAVIDGDGATWSDQYRFRRADGGYAEVLDRGTVIRDADGRAVRMIGAMLDTSALRRARTAVRESEDRLRLATDATGIGIWDFDPRTGALDWDVRTREMFGLPPDGEVDYPAFLAGLHPEDRDATDAAVQAALAPGGPGGYDVEYRTLAPDGAGRWIAAKGRAIFAGGEAVRFIGTVLDISDRKEAEAALRESEEFNRRILASSNDCIKVLSLDGHLESMSPGGLEIMEIDDFGTVRGAFWPDLWDEPERPLVKAAIGEALGGGIGRFEGFCRTGRGTLKRWDVIVSAIAGADGRPEKLLSISRDISAQYRANETIRESEEALRELNQSLEARIASAIAEREQAEEALRQSQKMEAVGQLTGGIAHDFNNLLTIITGNVDAARRHVGEEAPARVQRALGNALVGAERAAVLTQRLLAFSRRQPLNPRPVDPNKLVTGMSELLHRTLGETIAVETVLAAGLWRIDVDANQLENAILNLAVNARDAMLAGDAGAGKLTIETANTHIDRDYAAQNAGALPGQYVVICVSDTGCGMGEDTLARAFEPFFTTKEVGKGTGLGLSMVYGFVKQSGGHVKIYSEEEQGTTVRIYLPRLLADEAEEEERAELPVPEGTREETILVCEDDDDVRAYTVDVLRELGYRVLEAHDGPSALRLLERQEGRVDLLFTDVVLPSGMTGAVVAQEAKKLRPDLRILFTTGYARNAIVHHGRLDPGVELITKPFAYADLAARVRDMLDRP